MNSLTVVVLCVALAAANAQILGGALVGPAEPGHVIQGPGSSASVVGPDGSVIAANQPGGTVVAAPKAGGVVAGGIHGFAAAPAVVAARVAAPYAHPAVVAHHGAVVGAPLIARAGYPLLAHGSGLEGQYVHDYTEALFDNGQYHGEIYA